MNEHYSGSCGCDEKICVAAVNGQPGACPRGGRAERLIPVRIETRERVAPEPPTRPTEVAAQLVDGDRQDAYGHPLVNHERIAAFWTVRLAEKLQHGQVIEPHDVAALMRLAKEARLMQTEGHGDSLVDLAGYADVEHGIHDGYRTLPPSPYSSRFGFRRGEV
jgi:hypothetical protein